MNKSINILDENECLSSFKVILVGDSQVGKTTLIKCFTGEYYKNYVPTVGFKIYPLTLKTTKGIICFNIWDTAGQDKNMGSDEEYYIGAHAAIVMFDLTNIESYINVERWCNKIKKGCGPSIPIILCGNKLDIVNEVMYDEKNEYFRYSIPYYYTSAKSNYNLDKPFLFLTRELMEDDTLNFKNYTKKMTGKRKRSF